jgi:signal transduction histidine kinase
MARRIVELHHGVIEVESTIDTGSCFRIVLPIAEQVASPDQQ